MTGYEVLKSKRVEHGWSVRNFAKMAGISFTSVTAYESGEMRIGLTPVYRAKTIFGLLELPITEFFGEYYPYKDYMDAEISAWNNAHPVDYNYMNVKKRLTERISQIKRRGNIETNELEIICKEFSSYFGVRRDSDYILSKEEYDLNVMPILCHIRTHIDRVPGNPIGRVFVDAIHRTNYSFTDVSSLCGVTKQHLYLCINGKADFNTMRTETALKICYMLNVDFDSVFDIVEKSTKF
jgi:transcriptional regulator with XRE-family HTH domain